jgi:competence protein ComEA
MKILAMLAISAGLLFGAVDINNATKDQLISIKGIGDKKADAILTYRKDHCFKNVQELTAVKGLGDKFVEQNKKDLTIGKCKTK